MYNLSEYSWMMLDQVRSKAYLRALQDAVKPGCVVVDLGAGVGTWALIAARLGARKAYAIESSAAIHIARQLALANGLSSQLELVHDLSTNVKLPEPADIIVFDLHGQQPIFAGSLRAIIDARQRLLRPGGVMIPAREVLWATIVEAPSTYADCVGFWERDYYGIEMSAGKPFATDWMYKRRFAAEQAVTDNASYATLDYATLQSAEVVSEVVLRCRRPGTGHGLYLWFDSEVSADNSFSNAPGSPQTIYEGSFIPWPTPLELRPDDQVHLSISFRLLTDYLWSVKTSVDRQAASPVRFDQSSLRHNLPSLSNMVQPR